jgi:hypothetical protein
MRNTVGSEGHGRKHHGHGQCERGATQENPRGPGSLHGEIRADREADSHDPRDYRRRLVPAGRVASDHADEPPDAEDQAHAAKHGGPTADPDELTQARTRVGDASLRRRSGGRSAGSDPAGRPRRGPGPLCGRSGGRGTAMRHRGRRTATRQRGRGTRGLPAHVVSSRGLRSRLPTIGTPEAPRNAGGHRV